MFSRIIYNLALLLLAPFALIYIFYQMVATKKYRHNFFKRFGFGFPKIDKKEKKLIWVHAVSVGEARAVSGIVKRFKKAENPPIIIFSSITETGHAEAKKSSATADFHLFLPFDFYWVITPIVKRVKPDLLVISETDFWPNFILACKNIGAKIALVNGKMSKRSCKRYLQLKPIFRPIFKAIDLFCLQNDSYRPLFSSLGIPNKKIMITGNLKLDFASKIMTSKEQIIFLEDLGISPQDFVLVVGSTHSLEERLILEQIKPLLQSHLELRVFIVPRHPERFFEVEQLLQKQVQHFDKFSVAGHRNRVCLVDTMGKLNQFYQIADLAIIGGSFVPGIGGHNICEPAFFSVPVIFGPFMDAQAEMRDLVIQHSAGFQLTAEKLGEKVEEFVKSPSLNQQIGTHAQEMVKSLTGASERTFLQLKKKIKKSACVK